MAYDVDGNVVYNTNSRKGMRDQLKVLLVGARTYLVREGSYSETITLVDTHSGTSYEHNAQTILDWRI